MPSNVWYEITCPFPNFNGATVEVWEWTSNFIPHFINGCKLFIRVSHSFVTSHLFGVVMDEGKFIDD